MAAPRRGDGILKGPQVWVFFLLFGLGAWFYSRSGEETSFREDLSAPMPQGERYAGGSQAEGASDDAAGSAGREAAAGSGGGESPAAQSARMQAALDEVGVSPGPEGGESPAGSGAAGGIGAGEAGGVEAAAGGLLGAGGSPQGAGGSGGMSGAGGGSLGAGRSAGGGRASAGGGGEEGSAQAPAARSGFVPGAEPRNRLRPFENKTPQDTASMAQAVEGLGQQALLGGKELQRAQLARAAEDKALDGLMSEASSQGMGKPPPDAPPLAKGKTWPVKGGGRVSQEFGPTDFYLEPARTYQGKKYAHFHSGIDIAAPKGTPVLALDAGKVTFAGGSQKSGVSVIVAHENGLVTTYHHLDLGAKGPTVRPGQYIGAGQTVGFIGMTGMTTGPHLHFIAKKGDLVNPRTVLPAPQKK